VAKIVTRVGREENVPHVARRLPRVSNAIFVSTLYLSGRSPRRAVSRWMSPFHAASPSPGYACYPSLRTRAVTRDGEARCGLAVSAFPFITTGYTYFHEVSRLEGG